MSTLFTSNSLGFTQGKSGGTVSTNVLHTVTLNGRKPTGSCTDVAGWSETFSAATHYSVLLREMMRMRVKMKAGA